MVAPLRRAFGKKCTAKQHPAIHKSQVTVFSHQSTLQCPKRPTAPQPIPSQTPLVSRCTRKPTFAAVELRPSWLPRALPNREAYRLQRGHWFWPPDCPWTFPAPLLSLQPTHWTPTGRTPSAPHDMPTNENPTPGFVGKTELRKAVGKLPYRPAAVSTWLTPDSFMPCFRWTASTKCMQVRTGPILNGHEYHCLLQQHSRATALQSNTT